MSKPSITNCPNTFFRKFIVSTVFSVHYVVLLVCKYVIPHYYGGYCGEVPPLPIPNREVKLTCADGTAMQCGRVGSRLLLSRASITKVVGAFLFSYSSAFLTPLFPQIDGRSSFYLFTLLLFYLYMYSHSLHYHFLSKMMVNLL